MTLRPNHHHILVVEDDPDTAEFIEMLLTLSGYTVTLETTGAAGLTQTREPTPDLILLDYRLPDVLGVEVCRQL